MKYSSMNALYAMYAPTKADIQAKKGVCPEVQKKRNQCDWFTLAQKKKQDKQRNR